MEKKDNAKATQILSKINPTTDFYPFS